MLPGRVRLEVGHCEQHFEPLHVSIALGFLHFMPDRGDLRVTLRTGVGMQAADKLPVKLLDAATIRTREPFPRERRSDCESGSKAAILAATPGRAEVVGTAAPP